jgi:hypothetical protein
MKMKIEVVKTIPVNKKGKNLTGLFISCRNPAL